MMSLEQVLKENTEAVNKLIEALTNAARLGGCEGANSAAVTPPAEEHPATSEAKPITYEDMRKPFLALANKNRDAAVAILAKVGAAKLSEIEKDPKKIAIVFNKVKEAENV